MGYCISQLSCTNFWISKRNFGKATKAIQALHGQETITDSGGRHFSWVDREFYKIKGLTKILDAWRWRLELDEKGNGVGLHFEGEKYGDDDILLQAIAPYVRSGEIEMEGEDGCHWKWMFERGVLKELSGRVVYE